MLAKLSVPVKYTGEEDRNLTVVIDYNITWCTLAHKAFVTISLQVWLGGCFSSLSSKTLAKWLVSLSEFDVFGPVTFGKHGAKLWVSQSPDNFVPKKSNYIQITYKLNTLSIYSPWFEQFTPYSILILGLCITSFRVCIISSISYVKKAQSYFKNLSYLYIHLLSRNFFVKYVLKEIPLF